MGRSDWLNQFSWEARLAGSPMCVHSAVAFFPGGVRIVYIRSEPAGSSSVDAASVTGSLLFYVCCSAVLPVSGLLVVNYFSGKLVYLL